MMGDRGIIFSAPMVRALLDGRKTQTRRLMPQQEALRCTYSPIVSGRAIFNYAGDEAISRAPYAVGDRLYVREAIRCFADTCDDAEITYLADGRRWQTGPCTAQIPDAGLKSYFKLVDRAKKKASRAASSPSIHMPRWASRLTLTVTDVRVQRLQDISEADAIAEGIERCDGVGCSDGVARDMYFGVPQAGHEIREGAAREAYFDLWDSLHNPRGLCADDEPSGVEANPWIVAVSFDVRHGNIDAEATKCTR